ncbi:hypothetical protein I4F81_002808 [Pyropia yezoensis]|uniref:Uncharacterized protein n=1 Tax=Pyropia yezoensis TaxID=2788 RepID=A0ACC3BQH5_PYRYE|nr:hypothetical protein I4F81_002808 [Neopyropia yezoensis]
MATTDDDPFATTLKINTGWGSKHLAPGVVAEKLEGWTQRNVAADTPPEVQALMDAKRIVGLYVEFAAAVEAAPKVRLVGTINLKAVAAVVEEYAPLFAAQAGIGLFLCRKVQLMDR